MNVSRDIVHQDGDGGDEAWVGAMNILEDLELFFDLQTVVEEKKEGRDQPSGATLKYSVLTC